MKENKVNLNIYLVPEIKEYLVKNSEAYGMSISSYVSMIITTYRQQADALLQISKMDEMIRNLKELDNRQK